MRRALLGLAVAALTALSLAAPASAAQGQVTHFRWHGVGAEALWHIGPENAGTETVITVTRSGEGSVLFFDRFSTNVDANGTVTHTDISTVVTDGFTFTIDTAQLASASVSGTGLPATDCTLDADFNQTGCSPTIIDVSANWTGQGPISREVGNVTFKMGAYSFRSHHVGTNRGATATGTFTGTFGTDTLTANDLLFADLGTSRSGLTTICIGGGNC